jgi:hypothetical protein
MTPDEQKNLDDRLIDAAQHGKTKAVQKLLAAGANVHAKNDCALAGAACFGRTETALVLHAAGASVHDEIYDYALLIAAAGGHRQTVDVLRNAIKKQNAQRLELERQQNPLFAGTGLTLAKHGPEDMEALLREATEEQERMGTLFRTGMPSRGYIPLPQP